MFRYSLSVDVVTNDLYNIGVNDDQLNLIYECDSLSKVAVKTPVGLTKRLDLHKVVAQGEVISPLKCTISVDAIAESQVENLQRLQFGPQKCLKLHVGRKWKST